MRLTQGSPVLARRIKITALRNHSHTSEQVNMTKLRNARNKVLMLGDAVRTDMFNDWFRRRVVEAAQPSEWTAARDLYASYVRHARQYGPSLEDGQKGTATNRRVARAEMASETAWGRMMASVSIKTRRAGGNYYPLRLKQGA